MSTGEVAGLDTFKPQAPSHRAGYGGDELAALRERQVRAGGTMDAGEGAKLYEVIDELTATIAERDAEIADLRTRWMNDAIVDRAHRAYVKVSGHPPAWVNPDAVRAALRVSITRED